MRALPTIFFIIVLALLASALGGCNSGPALASEAAATALALGCWPDTGFGTPLPVTVTATAGPTLTPTLISAVPGATSTPRATTTALPRCTPQPDQTLVPWPTPLPTEPPYPTPANRPHEWSSSEVEILHRANPVLFLDLAVHPHHGWPVVAVVDVPLLTREPPRVFVRAYNYPNRSWGPTQSVDSDGSHPGRNFRSVAVAVAPDNAIHVLWGASEYPHLQLFAAQSRDYGSTWSPPEQIGDRAYFNVLDAVVGLDNTLYALATMRQAGAVTEPDSPVLLRRSPDGVWAMPEPIPTPFWYASDGALQIVADGSPAAALVALISAGAESPAGTVYLARRPLSGGSWSVGSRAPSIANPGELATDVRAISYPLDTGETGVTFSFGMRQNAPAFYSVSSPDGGRSWGPVQPIAYGANGDRLGRGAVAYDSQARRLTAVWICCADTTWGSAEGTHYASWSRPGDAWTPAYDTAANTHDRIPLVSGARGAGLSTLAQPLNSQYAWLAWIDDGQTVKARSLLLAGILPFDTYPGATPRPTASTGTMP